MSFQYSTIGDNTPENREHLEKLGYRKWIWVSTDNEEPFISTIAHSSEYMAFDNDSLESSAFRDDINCIGNPTLFQAVTAIREGSDYMQWFTCKVKDGLGNQLPDSWVLCTQKTLQDFGWVNNSPNSYAKNTPYHKATLAELQEHFK